MTLIFFCLWDHAWRIVASSGLLVQDGQGHTEVNSMQGHQVGQGTRAQDTWGEAERTRFVLKKKRLDRGVVLQCTIRKASYNIKFLLNVRIKVYHGDGWTLKQAPRKTSSLKVSELSLGKALCNLLQWNLLDSRGQTETFEGPLQPSLDWFFSHSFIPTEVNAALATKFLSPVRPLLRFIFKLYFSCFPFPFIISLPTALSRWHSALLYILTSDWILSRQEMQIFQRYLLYKPTVLLADVE